MYPDVLTCFYQNVRGLRTKFQYLMFSVPCIDYDIIAITETWLHKDILDSELPFYKYSLFRCDRDRSTTNSTRGGGVLLAINSKYPSSIISSHASFFEQICVMITFQGTCFIFCVVYIPPSCDCNALNKHIELLEDIRMKFHDANFVVLGDYNLSNLKWTHNITSNSFIPSNITTANAQKIVDGYNFFNFVQMNSFTNPHGNVLDLVFTNYNQVTVKLTPDYLVKPDSFHPPLSVELRVPLSTSPQVLKSDYSYYDFFSGDYIGLTNYLSLIDWESLLCSDDINTNINLFYDTLYLGLSKFVPLKKYKDPKFPIWYSKELKKKIFDKKIYHKLFKSYGRPEDYETFSYLRSECKSLTSKCYKDYIHHIENNLKMSPKSFWSFIRSKKSNSSVPDYVKLDDKIASTGLDVVNLFASFFGSVYSDANHIVDYASDLNNLHISSCSITSSLLLKKLDQLSNSKTLGPDGISTYFIKKCKFVLLHPLLILYTLSLKTGIFPDLWKITYLSPLHKGSDKFNVKNYRPISKISYFAKIFESIITDQLGTFFKPYIINEQHGFMPGRSTTTNLMIYTQFLLNALEHRSQVDAIYTDFQKAFDSVNHNLLLHKLKNSGIAEPLLTWLSSYLKNRIQIVSMKNFFSDPIKVTSGVPQGGHLSPLLFNIFINDIRHKIQHSNILLYADDLKIFKSISSLNDCTLLQEDFQNFLSWCNENHLILNMEKCKIITFSKKTHVFHYPYSDNQSSYLERVDNIRDLGILFTSNCNFKKHIEMICAKAFKMLGFVHRNTRDFKDLQTFKILYCALVRPILNYCTIVWSPTYSTTQIRVEKVQQKFLRLCAYKLGLKYGDFSYTHILSLLNLHSLALNRNLNDIVFVFKLVNNLIDCPDLLKMINFHVPSRSLRKSPHFTTFIHKSNYTQYSPVNRAMISCNQYSDIDFFNSTLAHIKNKCFLQTKL